MNQTKQLLADALIELCEIKSLDEITVTEIANKCNMTRQIFYYHFDDKYALAKWIHLWDNATMLLQTQGEAFQTVDWNMICTAYLSALQKRKKFYRNLYYSAEQKEFQRIMRECIRQMYVIILTSSSDEDVSEDVQYALQVYCYGGTQLIFEWIQTGMTMPIERLSYLLFYSMPSCLQEPIGKLKMSLAEYKELYTSLQ